MGGIFGLFKGVEDAVDLASALFILERRDPIGKGGLLKPCLSSSAN
jgi:hypothetical protein